MYQKVGITSVENKREKRKKKSATREIEGERGRFDRGAGIGDGHPHSSHSYGSVDWLHSSSGEEKHGNEYIKNLRASSPSSLESKDTHDRSVTSHRGDHGYTSEAADSEIQASESDALLGTPDKNHENGDSVPVLTAVDLSAEGNEPFQASRMRFVVAILLAVSSAFNSYIQMTFVAIW
jgi:hypothetical protein